MRIIPCVGAVIKDGDGRMLLIRRGHEPGKGLWSIPGGKIESGESDSEALVREVLEETGLTVRPGRLIGTVRRPAGAPDTEFDIRDYAADASGGTLTPGDDADDAVWADLPHIEMLSLTDDLLDTLRSWGVL
jgi:8-oxo-dGTP diphosphatase